jgi:hypothetical protein
MTPVAMSNIPPHLEVFQDKVKFFSPTDVDQCAKVLYAMASVENSQNEFSAQALVLKTEFSYQKSAKKMLKLIEKLV